MLVDEAASSVISAPDDDKDPDSGERVSGPVTRRIGQSGTGDPVVSEGSDCGDGVGIRVKMEGGEAMLEKANRCHRKRWLVCEDE